MDGKFTMPYFRFDIGNRTEFAIQPFGDIHRDSANCDVKKWHRDLDHWRKEDIPTLYLGMGDYNDFASWSERRAIRNSKLHDDTRRTLHEVARKNIAVLAQEIEFMRGNIIGLIEGNHIWEFDDGTTSADELGERLGTQSLGYVSYIRLSVSSYGRRFPVDIFACHGKGGGKLLGTSINKVADMRTISPMADIYIMGHDHKKMAIPSSVFDFRSANGKLKMINKQQWMSRSGSYLKGYVENESSYVSGALLPPSDLGSIRFIVSLNVKGSNKTTTTMVKNIKVEY